MSIPGLRVGDEDDELNPQAFSYTALTKAVHDSYTDREGAPQTDPPQPAPTFAARDDLWGDDFSKSGLQSIDYWARWAMLKGVPKTDGPVGVAVTGSASLAGSRRFLMPNAARRVLCQKAVRCLESYPGLPNYANNIQVNTYYMKLLNPNFKLTNYELERMGRALDYRLCDIMERATVYVTALHVKFPRCEDWEIHSRCRRH